MEVVTRSMEMYNNAMNNLSDPRTKDFFLMSSPLYTYSCAAIYLLIVLVGPKYMAKREPYKLCTVLKIYNFSLVLLSLYMFHEFLVSTVLNPKFSLSCQPMDYSDDPMAVRLARACWLFFFSKILEFADTFFFILRKKNSQLTFLHVYHHFTMPVLWWVGVRFIPGGESYFSAMINCLIHVLMYSYYGLASFGPSMHKYLWWKKYMTSLQLIQFWSVFFKTLYVMRKNCFPVGFCYALLIYILSHIALFSNFYIQSYLKKTEKQKEIVQSDQSGGDKKTD